MFVGLFLLGTATSCHSHKKAKDNDRIKIEDTIDRGKKGKKKKDKKESGLRKKIAEEAKTWVGTPYKYAHSEKGRATDCSGLVVVVYQKIADIKLPRNSAQQADFCNDIKEKDVRTGDLVFFATGSDRRKVSHVGVMIDDCQFVHASGSKGVIISEMTTPYYRRNLIKFGRVPGLD